MRPLTRWILFPALLAALGACGDSPRERPVQELVGSTMGTTFSIKVIAPPESLDLPALQKDIEAALDGINRTMSTYLSDSELSRFNASESVDWFEVSPELCHAVEAARVVSEFTGGAFDVTVGPLVNLWGFGPAESTYEPPGNDVITAAMQDVGYTKLHVDCAKPALRKETPGIYVDLSAFAKGYAVDEVAQLLDARTLLDYLVEIGGEMRLRGMNARSEPWAIAIETPDRAERSVQTVVHLTDSSMATSGDYRNFFEHEGRFYTHTIDPRTGYPVTHNGASVTVVAESAAFADAAATALLVLGPDTGMKLAEDERIAAYFLLRLDGDFEERMSSHFTARVLEQ
jgi:thiamine biosynthesis lipoprotein